MKNGGDKIRCSRVEICGSTICEVRGPKTLVTIRREQVRRISLIYDTSARYPFFQFFLGFTLVVLGFMGLIVSWLVTSVMGAPIDIDPDSIRLPVIPIALWLMVVSGVWSLLGVFRAGYHLLIETEEGCRKIFFGKTALQDIKSFIRRAAWRFGYEIDTTCLDKINTLPDP